MEGGRERERERCSSAFTDMPPRGSHLHRTLNRKYRTLSYERSDIVMHLLKTWVWTQDIATAYRSLAPTHEPSPVPARGRRSASWPSPWPPTRASAPTASWAASSPASSSATSSAPPPGASVRSSHRGPALRGFVASSDRSHEGMATQADSEAGPGRLGRWPGGPGAGEPLDGGGPQRRPPRSPPK